MANTKSAEKRYRQSEERRARNASVRSTVRSTLKKAHAAIASKDPEQIKLAVREAISTLDKAASKGVYHGATASRRIGRLMKAARSSS